jgi:hypothetical protein
MHITCVFTTPWVVDMLVLSYLRYNLSQHLSQRPLSVHKSTKSHVAPYYWWLHLSIRYQFSALVCIKLLWVHCKKTSDEKNTRKLLSDICMLSWWYRKWKRKNLGKIVLLFSCDIIKSFYNMQGSSRCDEDEGKNLRRFDWNKTKQIQCTTIIQKSKRFINWWVEIWLFGFSSTYRLRSFFFRFWKNVIFSMFLGENCRK